MTAAFRTAGIDTAAHDARLLAAAILGCDAVHLLTERDRPIGTVAGRLAAAAQRRIAREPVSRILGVKAFFGRDYRVTPATLDPRPDSECVVETALDLLRGLRPGDAPLRVLDIGTGTGCLLISILAEINSASGLGTDIDPDAIAVARENATALGVTARTEWAVGTGLAPVRGTFDCLIANPPYIRSSDIGMLAPEVRVFDPRAALDGGADGLDVYRLILCGVIDVVPAGWIVFEVGYDQADAVLGLLAGAIERGRLAEVRTIGDISGTRRGVAARTRL